MLDRYPGASSYRDRHGKTRWRFRRKGRTVALPGLPGDVDFDAAYLAAVEGRKAPRAEVIRMPGAALPQSFGAAWRKVTASAEWLGLDPATRNKNTTLAEAFLGSRVAAEHDVLWRDVPVRDLRRRHLKTIIADHSHTPHKAKHLIVAMRKMIYAALEEEWIEVDPSYKLVWRPGSVGWKAWTPEAMATFEKRWPVGTTPRLVYALALWLGNRRDDVATLRWDQRCIRTVATEAGVREVDGFLIRQGKTGKELFLPINPMMADVLAVAPREKAWVVSTQYGKAFSTKSLTGQMAHWNKAAGLAPGFTLHGLRKTLGKLMAESGASTRQLMDMLGHDDIAHAELYSREAQQAVLATEGMDKVVRMVRRNG